ncbi:hypothetical protein [Jejuia pallidilutea]
METVKPNRLKIKIDFDNEILSNNTPLTGNLDVKWLHGAPGKNLKAEIKAKFTSTYTAFDNFKDYTFYDPTRKFQTEEINVFEGKVNDQGIASINKKLNVGKNAPGMLNVQFLVRAFENGGDFSMDAFTKHTRLTVRLLVCVHQKVMPMDLFLRMKIKPLMWLWLMKMASL